MHTHPRDKDLFTLDGSLHFTAHCGFVTKLSGQFVMWEGKKKSLKNSTFTKTKIRLKCMKGMYEVYLSDIIINCSWNTKKLYQSLWRCLRWGCASHELQKNSISVKSPGLVFSPSGRSVYWADEKEIRK